jgi:hypothetical protein
MALDPSLLLRQAIVTHLKADAALLALVPADRIFGEQPGALPDRPFVRYGEDESRPRRSSCWDGATVDFPVHAFSADKFTDEVKAMSAAISAALDGLVIELSPAITARLQWLGSQVMRDGGDPNAWHGFSRFQATC